MGERDMELPGERACERRAGSWRWRVAVAVVIGVVLFQLNPAKAVAMDFALKAGRFQPAKSDLRKVTSGSWFATALEVPVGQLGAGKLSLEVAWLKERRSPDPGFLIESDIVPVTLNYTLGRGLFQWGTGAGLYYVRIVESGPPPIPASPNFGVEDVSGDFPGTQKSRWRTHLCEIWRGSPLRRVTFPDGQCEG